MATGGSDVVITKVVSSKRGGKTEKDRSRILARHRMHRSSVRPFFCCGSQLSLNSIPELKDFSTIETTNVDDDYEDLSDTEGLDDDNVVVVHTAAASKCDKPSTRQPRFQNTKRKKGISHLDKPCTRKKFWSLKLRGKLQLSKQSHCVSESELSSAVKDNDDCVCTSYRHSITGAENGHGISYGSNASVPVTAMAHLQLTASRSVPYTPASSSQARNEPSNNHTNRFNAPLPFISNLNALYPINDIDEQLIAQRRFEMEHGVDLGENADVWVHRVNAEGDSEHNNDVTEQRTIGQYPTYGAMGLLSTESDNLVNTPVPAISVMSNLPCSNLGFTLHPWLQLSPQLPSGVHTQVDYKHHLVPDLRKIINSSFYWGVMDRYQAEKLIENKAEGTFLLRDSAQDEFLFSVSFRRYGRSLHARIEQWNHKFSFDSRDPGVFATDSVCGLIEHYKDPSRCMFFEPMLTQPLHRNFPFSLQHLTRAVICNNLAYDDINQLTLPPSLKEYLRFYHYKQKVRVRRFDL